MLGLQQANHVVDIGSHQIKMVEARYLRKGVFQVSKHHLVEAPDESFFPRDAKSDVEIGDVQKNAIRNLFRVSKLKRFYVNILFPDFVFQTITLPTSEKMSEEERKTAVTQEIAAYIPDEAERKEWIIQQKELGKLHSNNLTFIAMTKSRHVMQLGNSFQQLGAYPVVMDLALLNAINTYHDYLKDAENRDRNIGILYFGHEASSLAIYKDGTLTSLHVRGISTEGPQELVVGGKAFTRRIQEHFKFTPSQAEAYKREEVFFLPEFVPEQDKITNYQVIKPVFGELVRGLFALTEHYVATFREFKVDEIILTGGGANFSNIDVVLGGHLNILIKKGSSIVSMVDPAGNELSDDLKNILAPAVGACAREE